MTLQISNNAVRTVHPKASTGVPQGATLISPQRQTNLPTIALHKSGQVSMLQKPTLTKTSSAGDNVKLQPSAQTEQPKVVSSQPQQISFQVPLNWSGTGSNKSLLDSGKVSVISATQGGTQSVVKTVQSSSSVLKPFSSASGSETSHLTSIISQSSSATTTTAAINNSSLRNLQAGVPLSQLQKPVTTVTIANIPKITAAKGGSFVLSAGNKVAFVPSSQVVTQIVKTDSKSVGKVTMAEAQIMLPSGPAKISWPVPPHTKTDNKHILLTKPSLQSGSPTGKVKPADISGVMKSGSVTANLVGSSKLVTDGGTHGKIVQGNSATRIGPPKNLILQTQRSWELVKQASLLMPKKNVPSANLNTEPQTMEKPVEEDKTQLELKKSVEEDKVQTELEKLSELDKTKADSCDKTEEKPDNESEADITTTVNEDKKENQTESNSAVIEGERAEEVKEKVNELEQSDSDDQIYATVEPVTPENYEEVTKIEEDNNNEIHKNEDVQSSMEDTNKKLESEVPELDDKEIDTCTNNTAIDSDSCETTQKETVADNKSSIQKEENLDEKVDCSDTNLKLEPMDTNVKLAMDTDVKLEPMDTEDTSSNEIKPTTESKKSTGDDTGDFDAVGAMEWKDGVGELPGSDLKVQDFS